MTERDPSKGPAPHDDKAVARERQVHDLHRLETGQRAEDFPAGYRVAGLDTSTRPDPGAPAVSVAQRGATGRRTATGRARAVRQRRRTWANRLRSEEHTSELQSRGHLVCRLLLEKKNQLDRGQLMQ